MTETAVQANMTAEEYFAAPGLSHSGMKDLAVSPLRYWYLHINPDRPKDEPTPAMRIGTALHCAVLEPTEFDQRYCCELDLDQFPGCLDTVEQMRAWLRERGATPKGTRKSEMIAQVKWIDPNWPIAEVLEREHAELHAGKIMLKREDWQRVNGATGALLREPSILEILSEGEPEVCMFAKDPDTGVQLKCRMDWFHPKFTFDVKTFTQMRGKSIDESVADALYYEGYLRQSDFYTHIRSIHSGEKPPFIFGFVESDAPHEVRIKKLKPGSDNLYSVIPADKVRELIELYAVCLKRYGDRPWREQQRTEPLCDTDIKALSFGVL